MRTFAAILALGLGATSLLGCVSQGRYDALEGTLKASQAAVAERDAANEDLRRQLAEEQQRAATLEEKIRRLEQELRQVQQAKERMEGTNAAMLADKARLQASVEEMRAALAELSRRKAEADQRIAEFRGLLERFRTLIDAGKLRVKIVDGRMVVELASDVLFASGSARLSKEGEAAIAEVAGVLASIAERKFQVEGHTDNVPIRSATYPSNWELAAARALTVVQTMLAAGMPPERISAASYGEAKPAKPNDSAAGRAANRRIEIVVVPDLSSLPGFEELERAGAEGK